MVNGPEDLSPETDLDAVDWDWVDWFSCEREVRRLRQRIFKATREGNWPKVRSLQKLMLRSRSNTLVSVRQVAQRNAGRKTAGIDGEVALTSQARAAVAAQVVGVVDDGFDAQRPPVRRVGPTGCPADPPSEPYVPLVAAYGSSKPRGRAG